MKSTFLEKYYFNILNYDLIYKYNYVNINEMPKFQKIVLTFSYNKEINLKFLFTQLLAIELLSLQKGVITKKTTASISLKVRKGSPVGCKVTLRKKLMYIFLLKMIINFFPLFKQFEGYFVNNNNCLHNSISFEVKKVFNFSELENYYQAFNRLQNLHVSLIVLNTLQLNTFFYLLKSVKFPITKK